jgi:hypothetical protein
MAGPNLTNMPTSNSISTHSGAEYDELLYGEAFALL